MHHNSLMKSALVLLIMFVWIAGCGRDRQDLADKTPDLKQAIAAIKGTYTWRSDLNQYVFSHKSTLEELLVAQSPDVAVTTLIDCLDDTSASASMVGGKPVPVGIVCYEALTQLVCHEPTDPNGDIAADWPGSISLFASPQEMRKAKTAWKKAADEKLLSFL